MRESLQKESVSHAHNVKELDQTTCSVFKKTVMQILSSELMVDVNNVLNILGLREETCQDNVELLADQISV